MLRTEQLFLIYSKLLVLIRVINSHFPYIIFWYKTSEVRIKVIFKKSFICHKH